MIDIRGAAAWVLVMAACCSALAEEEVPPGSPAERDAEAMPRIAVVGGEVHTLAGRVLEVGTVLVAEGRIQAVRRGARVPSGFEVIDASGRRVYPGFVAATAEGLGVPGFLPGREEPLAVRVSHALDSYGREMALAASHGITTAYVPFRVSPGEEQPFLGTGSIIRVQPGGEVEEMVLREPAAVEAALDDAARRHAFRMVLREAEAGEMKEGPKREVLAALLDREIPLRAGAGDLQGVLETSELTDALGLRLIVDRPVEAWAVAGVLADRDVGVIQFVRTQWFKPRGDELRSIEGGWRFDAPARLLRAGVAMAVVPGQASISPWGVAGRDLMNLPMEAAFAVRGGLSEEQALRAITLDAARLLGFEHRVGSLRRGKDADLIVVDGDPLHYRSFVRLTIAGGRITYDASKSERWRRILERRDEALEGPPAWPDRPRP